MVEFDFERTRQFRIKNINARSKLDAAEARPRNVMAMDPTLAELARRLGVNYVSLYGILCNPDGCLTRLGDTGDSLIQWDESHLTKMGFEFVASKFPD